MEKLTEELTDNLAAPISATAPAMAWEQIEGEWIALERMSENSEHIGGMVVRSDEMRKILKTITRLGPFRQTVLIEGESGTGKELIARALHTSGKAPVGPFVTFNCSNLLESLAEAQLFGHVKGAFTDAREDSLGYFRSAHGGTLFLDEIGELPLNLQPKLLRAVENHEVQPVGSSHVHQVDIRLIAATNRDLSAMIKAGQFREDLYYRLHALSILIPPLRARTAAIPCLVAHFIDRYNKLFAKNVTLVSRSALRALCSYSWPGNIRQLAHVIETTVLMSDSDRIAVADLSQEMLHEATPSVDTAPIAAIPFGDPEVDSVLPAPQLASNSQKRNGIDELSLLLDNVIKKTLLRSLEETAGNRRRAADLLGVSRSTLYRMLARYGLGEGGKAAAEGTELVL
ncbi:MAG TPA: sigma-54 dependent transcriptional regulator [Candidatus Binataceae bacterium]|nr:sigma-54 dependent transcriptional regulator [Candidatus Binataceae bacterium]